MKRHKPLNLEYLESIRIDGESPDLEIVRKDENCSSLIEDGPTDSCSDIANKTDEELNDAIECYKKHLLLKLSDGGMKVKIYLGRLLKEQARRQSQTKKVSWQNGTLMEQLPEKRSDAMVKKSACLTAQRPHADNKIPKTGCQVEVIEDSNAPPEPSSLELEAMKGRQLNFDAECTAFEVTQEPSRNLSGDQASPSCDQGHSLVSRGKRSSSNRTFSKLRSQAVGGGDQVSHPYDLEESPVYGKHNVCHSCNMKSFASRLSLYTVGDESKQLCTQCKKKAISSPGTFSSPVTRESLKVHHLYESSGEPSAGRLGVVKQGHVAVGETPDTAMELSDDEENQQENSPALVLQTCHDYHPRRQGLRSTFKRKAGVKIAYPSSGDPEAVEVQYSDLQHLLPSEFLNDTVIDFYIKYIQEEKILNPEKSMQFHFFNSFFYKKLTVGKKKAKGSDYFLKLRKWTKGINIFEKLYLLMPIHDRAHWSLAIICFPRGEENKDAVEPYILHLDSMTATAGHVTQDIFKALKSYLEAEWKYLSHENDSAQQRLKVLPAKSIHKRVQVPLQDNEWDCGLFVLYYIERFVQEAPLHFKSSDLEGMFSRSWFKPDEASQLREIIYKLLESLFDL